ncbi:MAG: GTPase Era [Pseudomonadota bacterium]
MSEFRDSAGYRCGFVAVVGRPNVGKSTLMNHYVGAKVSIVSPRPQTTRHRILGVQTRDDAQIVFVDTPGLHVGQKKAINRVMNRSAVSALSEAELVLWLLEAGRFTQEDRNVVERLSRVRVPVIAVVNKVDQITDKKQLLPFLQTVNEQRELHTSVPISALKGVGTDSLRQEIVSLLPESPAMFPDEMVTDKSATFRIAEMIREKLTLRLRQELPYGLTVQTDQMKHRDDGKMEIHTTIFVERDSQKGIVVGKGGQNLKAVGSAARRDIERMLGEPVHLDLWVKVRDNWADSEQDLNRLGFDMGD